MSQAYRKAYNAEDMRDSSVRTEASREAAKPHVAEAIQNLKNNHQPTKRKVEALQEDWIIQRLQEEAIDESNPASLRVRALEVLGRTLGLFDGDRAQKFRRS